MCVLNSITLDANDVKLPNIIVNAISVLIISLNNSIKAGEKVDNFKKRIRSSAPSSSSSTPSVDLGNISRV
jgi:hypothetical protein